MLSTSLQMALEQMSEEDILEHQKRQTVLFDRAELAQIHHLRKNPPAAMIPVGLLEAPRNPDRQIGAIAEIQIDWAIEPATPRLSIPLPLLMQATAKNPPDRLHRRQGRLKEYAVIRLTHLLLKSRLFLQHLTIERHVDKRSLDVLFRIELHSEETA